MEAFERCESHARELTARHGSVTVRLAGDSIFCAKVELEPPLAPVVSWLKETLEATALAGVQLHTDADRNSLFTLAARLRDNLIAARRTPSFEKLWSEPVPGMVLVEPRFQGAFLGEDEYSERAQSGCDGFQAAEALEASETLRKHRGIAKRIADLESLLKEQALATGGETVTIGQSSLVDQIVTMVPEDVRDNPIALLKTVEAILKRTTDQLRSRDLQSNEDYDFRGHLLRTCQKFFVREDAENEKDPEKEDLPQGHPGDELVEDDLAALLREIAQLPAVSPDLLLAISTAEQFGVCLHQLVTAEDSGEPAFSVLAARPASGRHGSCGGADDP